VIKHKGLGRGLDALLGGERKEAAQGEALATLSVALLRPGRYQPRTRMSQEALAELAESIKVRGVIQPVLVRPVNGNQYEILAGERRWRAAKMAGLTEIPALIREVADEVALGIGLIENIQREDLNPLEEAAGIQRLIDEFKLTHEEAAKAVARSRSAVTNLLRLLELSKPVQDMLMEGQLDMGHARALLGLAKAKQVEVAQQIFAKGLSVREAEHLARVATQAPRAGRAVKRIDPDIRRLQEDVSERLGTSVRIKASKKNKGVLTIAFSGLEQLEEILGRLRR
jgi:ParB family transcriptional regulator, chromosome partitioning protein